MPIRRIKSRRPRVAPFFFFKGSISQVGHLPRKTILHALQRSGIFFSDRTQAVQTAERLRSHVLLELEKFSTEKFDRHAFSFDTPSGKIFLMISNISNGRISITPWPLLHGVREQYELPTKKVTVSSFAGLLGIVSKTFEGKRGPNFMTVYARRRMALTEPSVETGTTNGDRYAIEFIAPFKDPFFLEKAEPSQILCINIALKPESSAEQIRQKKEYYKKTIPNIPIHFV